jgi:hypothetical protein
LVCIALRALVAPLSGSQAYDWLQFARYLLPAALANKLGEKERRALFRMCRVFKKLSSRFLTSDDVDQLEVEIPSALVQLERDWPIHEMTAVTHVLVHFVERDEDGGFFRLWGPPASWWLFGMERCVALSTLGFTFAPAECICC